MTKDFYPVDLVSKAATPAHLFLLGRGRVLPPSLDPAQEAPRGREGDGQFEACTGQTTDFSWWISTSGLTFAVIEQDALTLWDVDDNAAHAEALRTEAEECFKALDIPYRSVDTVYGVALASTRSPRIRYLRPAKTDAARLVAILPRDPAAPGPHTGTTQ